MSRKGNQNINKSPEDLVAYIFNCYKEDFKSHEDGFKKAELATHLAVNKLLEINDTEYYRLVKAASLVYEFPIL